jgi:hypothetical protein
MPVPPNHLKDLTEGTVDHHASLTFPDLQEVTIRWRGSFGYLTAWAGEGDDNDEQIPLCRIEYLGDDDHSDSLNTIPSPQESNQECQPPPLRLIPERPLTDIGASIRYRRSAGC